jgi:hypothetical protein
MVGRARARLANAMQQACPAYSTACEQYARVKGTWDNLNVRWRDGFVTKLIGTRFIGALLISVRVAAASYESGTLMR